MSKPLIIIGHRMGQGQKIAKGITEAGGTAIVIEGMAADMKLGDVMNEHQADLGLSFCGSGGAGAITAQTKYGYQAKHHLRTIEAGISALKEGNTVLGFGFMDTEELGRKIVEAYLTMTSEKGE